MVVDAVPVYSCCAWENQLVAIESFGFALTGEGSVVVVCVDGEFERRSSDNRGVAKIPDSLSACWLSDAA